MADSSSTVAKALQKIEEQLNCYVCQENFTQPKDLPGQCYLCQKCISADIQLVKHFAGQEMVSMTEITDFNLSSTNVEDTEFSKLADRCKVSRKGIVKTRIHRKTSFTLAIIPTPNSVTPSLPTSLISCQLSAPGTTCLTDCNITGAAAGRYKVSYTPVTGGLHQLRVRVGDVDIPGSPFTVQVKMRGTPLRTIEGMSRPCDAAVAKDGSVVVTEYLGHHVTVLDKEGKKRVSFGSKGKNIEQFYSPTGVVITHNNKIIVSDEFNGRIQKFNMEGRVVAMFGSQGHGKLQFCYPHGITVDKNNKILVADKVNHRIQVLNSDFTFSHSFGSCGSQPGQFQHPYCIAIDSKGMLYVTDRGNHRVQKFTPKGVFVVEFGKEGKGERELTEPVGIAIDTTTDTVYVSSNHKVSAFTTDGKLLGEFGRHGSGMEEFDIPTGLAVDENTGDLYVCDCNNDRLVVY